MRVSRPLIICALLMAALVGAGLWARDEMMIADIQNIFSIGPLSPIRAEYQSVVDDAQLHDIQRREQELHKQLQAETTCWRWAMITAFAAAAIVAAVFGRLLFKASRTADETSPRPPVRA